MMAAVMLRKTYTAEVALLYDAGKLIAAKNVLHHLSEQRPSRSCSHFVIVFN